MSYKQKFNLKVIFTVAASLCLAIAAFFVASSSVLALETGINYGTATGLGSQDVRLTIMNIIRIALGFLGVIAIIIILYGGFMWMTSGGSEEKIDTARKTLRNGAIGLVIILLSFAIASFIINQLQDILGTSGPGGGGGPDPCSQIDCSQLGRGIIESVYPVPFSRDVARNTLVMVTFKVEIVPSSIIDGAPDDPNQCSSTAPCQGDLLAGSVQIYPYNDARSDRGRDQALEPDEVRAFTTDGKTFVFDPIDYLGSSNENTWYETVLTGDIEKFGTNESAFPGLSDGFIWSFEVGTQVDLDPVEQDNVFPQPDNQSDLYESTDGTAARGTIEVLSVPQIAQQPNTDFEVENLTPATLQVASFSGDTHDATQDFVVCVVVDGTEAQITPKVLTSAYGNANYCNTQPDLPSPPIGLSQSAAIQGGVAFIGLDMQLTFNNLTGGVDTFYFKVLGAKNPDTLTVDGTQFRFVAPTANPAPGEISIGSTVQATAGNIADAITEATLPRVAAVSRTGSGSLAFVDLGAKLTNQEGNNIRFTATTGWAELCNADGSQCSPVAANLSGGSDGDAQAQINGAQDQPRNAVVRIDFNEALNPLYVPSVSPDEPVRRILVRYKKLDNNFIDSNPANDTWSEAPGTFYVSNQYKTIEFLSDNECLDEFGNPLANSCGDTLYCLPVNPGYCQTPAGAPQGGGVVECDSDLDCNPGNTCAYEATEYQVVVKAGKLKTCSNNTDCVDPNFPVCAVTPDGTGVCQSDGADPVNFPEVALVANGMADAANNSFNANLNTTQIGSLTVGRADGPEEQSGQTPYNLNSPDQVNGDDLTWSFFVNRDINLTPPIIQSTGPTIGERGVSLTSPIYHTFDKILMSNSLRPNGGYRDGACRCSYDPSDPTNPQGSCSAGQVCKKLNGQVVTEADELGRCAPADGSEQLFCLQDDECNDYEASSLSEAYDGEALCINRKYLTLLDTSNRRVGWWTSNNGLDTQLPLDGYADRSKAFINHTIFNEVTNYGSEIGSGVRDIYQNCFLPSGGPSATDPVVETGSGYCSISTELICQTDSSCGANQFCVMCDPETDAGCCEVTEGRPYCCNGIALSQESWLTSTCNTGF